MLASPIKHKSFHPYFLQRDLTPNKRCHPVPFTIHPHPGTLYHSPSPSNPLTFTLTQVPSLGHSHPRILALFFIQQEDFSTIQSKYLRSYLFKTWVATHSFCDVINSAYHKCRHYVRYHFTLHIFCFSLPSSLFILQD